MPEPEATAITGSITSSLVLGADDPAALARALATSAAAGAIGALSATQGRCPKT
jgi:hypothetical protein